MVRKLTTLATLAAAAVLVWMVGSMFGVDFSSRFKHQFLSNAEQDRLTLDETNELCLALEIWHDAEKGSAGKVIMRLVGVVALNHLLLAPKERNVCTSFEKADVMLSNAHPAESLLGASIFEIRKVGVVTKETLGTAATATFLEAKQIARELLAAVASKKRPASILPPNLEEVYGCADKFIRSFEGLLAVRIPGGFETLREDFKKEGRIAKPTIAGYEFYCKARS